MGEGDRLRCAQPVSVRAATNRSGLLMGEGDRLRCARLGRTEDRLRCAAWAYRCCERAVIVTACPASQRLCSSV